MAEHIPEQRNKLGEAEVVGYYAAWPPQPPIGQLRYEDIDLPETNPEAEKAHLYRLLAERYGLTQQDVFAIVPTDEMWNEGLMLKVIILSLEGWPDAKIAECLDKSKGMIRRKKSELTTETLKDELIRTIKSKTARWYSLIAPETRKTQGQMWSNEENVRAIEKVFNDYLSESESRSVVFPRTRLFTFEEKKLPSPFIEGWRGTDNVLLALRLRIVDGLDLKTIATRIGSKIDHDRRITTTDEQRMNGVEEVFKDFLSAEARKLLANMGIAQSNSGERASSAVESKWTEQEKRELAERIVRAPVSITDLLDELGERRGLLTSARTRWARQIIREHEDDPQWRPWIEELKRTPLAAFLVRYADSGFQEALSVIERMSTRKRGRPRKPTE